MSMNFLLLIPDLPLWGFRNRRFLFALCHLKIWRPNLEVATKWFLHQQTNLGMVLVPCCTWKCLHTSISVGVGIPELVNIQLFPPIFWWVEGLWKFWKKWGLDFRKLGGINLKWGIEFLRGAFSAKNMFFGWK